MVVFVQSVVGGRAGSGVILQAGGSMRSGWSRRRRAGMASGAVAFVMAASLFAVGAGGNSPGLLSRMPEAPAKQLISSKCGSACHAAEHVLDQTRSRDDWTDVVVLMRDYGAEVSVEDQKAVVAYLAKNFGRAPAPAKPASPPPVTIARANSSRSSGVPSEAAAASRPAPHAPRSSQAAQPSDETSAAVKTASAANGGTSAAAVSGGLPPGSGKELVQTKCTVCHNLDRVIGSHRTRAEWQQLVTAMQDYGADVYDEDEKTVVNYLSRSFSASDSSKGAAASGAPAK
jgi:cytochrome c5